MSGIVIVLFLIGMVKFLFSDNPGDGVAWNDNGFRYVHRSRIATSVRGIAKMVVLFVLVAVVISCCSGI